MIELISLTGNKLLEKISRRRGVHFWKQYKCLPEAGLLTTDLQYDAIGIGGWVRSNEISEYSYQYRESNDDHTKHSSFILFQTSPCCCLEGLGSRHS